MEPMDKSRTFGDIIWSSIPSQRLLLVELVVRRKSLCFQQEVSNEKQAENAIEINSDKENNQPTPFVV